jgi:hypothetical protein
MSDTQAVPDDQSQRLREARHEYNNIAAIVSLTRSPAVLEQVRRLWDEFRHKYPDFAEDPDGVADILSSNE